MTSNHHQDLQGPRLNAQGGHDEGMESLSALFDGELHGDAARFAMKRLGHAPRWRQAVGNWQLMGDAMRGQARSVAPRDFAARVAAAVSVEAALASATAAPPAVVVAAVPASSARRRRWIGGAALAASVAMVAMFVARPLSSDSGAVPGVAMPAPTELTTAPASSPIPAPAPARPAVPEPLIQAGAATRAVADVPRRASERRSRGQIRGQGQRVALRASKRPMAAPAIARAAGSTAIAIAEPVQHAGTNPFRPPHAEVVSRPWPRAVLPVSSNGAFTASYGTGASSSPSFYPFEPRLPNADEAVSAPVEAHQRRR